MSNPAKYLAEFFERDADGQHAESFFRLIRATVRLESELDARERAGVKVTHLRLIIPEVRNALRMSQSDDLTIMSTSFQGGTSRCVLDPRAISLLHVASELIEVDDFASETTLSAIRRLLAEVKQAVIADNSIDPDLRLFLSRSVTAIEAELDQYEITGDFELREALLTLFGLLRAAEGSSSEPNRWEKIWDEHGKPIAQGLIVSVPQLALSTAALFSAIQS